MKLQKGSISFVSDAPLEIISASTRTFKAIYEPNKKQFAVTILMNTFVGFNGDLQTDHYNENYLETQKYPEAKFVGKIIEPLDCLTKGRYTVRAKGKFTLHGITQDKTILCIVQVLNENEIIINADFELNLAEYNISIPKIVNKKIAENIKVKFNATLKS
ncbi:MAG: YceI family protein [Chitinophagaceae bacterium]